MPLPRSAACTRPAQPRPSSSPVPRVKLSPRKQTRRSSLPMESDQPALLHRRGDEAAEQGMRGEGARLQFGVELHPDEPRVVVALDDLGQDAVRRQAGELQARALDGGAVADVDLVAVTV